MLSSLLLAAPCSLAHGVALGGVHNTANPKSPSVFKLNQGRNIDILNHDYPHLLTRPPEFSIFTPEITLHDPLVSGMLQYKGLFRMMRFLRHTTMHDSEIMHRIVVRDETIHVRWSVKLWMDHPLLPSHSVVHLDGLSLYDLDREGKIYRHTLKNIVLRGDERAKTFDIAWLVPQHLPMKLALFEAEGLPAVKHNVHTRPPQASLARETPMERAARERTEDLAKQPKRPKKERIGFLNAMKKRLLPQTCESNYDCERPMVCCDLLVGSVCCSGGMLIPQAGGPVLRRQAIPIPVEVDPKEPF